MLMSTKTAQVFDLSFKHIMHEASSIAIVHLINGIYKKNYPLDTAVEIWPSELIKKHPKTGRLKKIVTDIVIALDTGAGKDVYLMEAQINDDIEMSLRVFNYSVFIALRGKTISDDGSCMEITMPSPAVIYWETSKTKDFLSITIRFPGNKSVVYKVPTFKVLQHSVSELAGMVLLLPFYILKIREELKKSDRDSEKRKKLSEQLDGYIAEIGKVLEASNKNNYITEKDVALLLGRLSDMYSELYGDYEEFTDMDARLKKFADTSWSRTWDEGIAKAEAKAEKRGISQGINQGLLQAAKAMKASGEAMSKIMRYTGLSRREVIAL